MTDETSLHKHKQDEEVQPNSKQLPSVGEKLPNPDDVEYATTDSTSVKESPTHEFPIRRKRTTSFRTRINNQNDDGASAYAVKVLKKSPAPRKLLTSKYKRQQNIGQRRATTRTKPIQVSCKVACEFCKFYAL